MALPVPDASLAAGAAAVSVSRGLTGLDPATTYHFRLVAANSAGTTASPGATFRTYAADPVFGPCPNHRYRTGLGARLPDCRAYEQVTPVDKNGGNAELVTNSAQAAADGHAVTFYNLAGIPGGVGSQGAPTYVAIRGGEDWSARGLLPPPSFGTSAGVLGWTPDLATAFANANPQDGSGNRLLARDNAIGSFATMVPYTVNATYFYVGASADGSKVFFEERTAKLVPEAATGQDNLYVWDRATGVIKLVGVLPDSACGTPPCVPAGGSFGGAYDWDSFGTSRGGGWSRQFTQDMHVVSADGARVYFTAGGTGQIYLRQDPTGSSPSTVHVSRSRRGTADPNGSKPAILWGATPDGAHAFFTSCEKLTDNSTAVSTAASSCTTTTGVPSTTSQGSDLYRFDATTGAITDITIDGADPKGADVRGVLGYSHDGSYVYFAASGVLAPGASPGDCRGAGTTVGDPTPNPKSCNLYLWHDDGNGGQTTYIATLNSFGPPGNVSDADNWASNPQFAGSSRFQVPARVSSDGRVLLFRSTNRLTGYDNTEADPTACPDKGISGNPCAQLFRYSAADDKLDCVSCHPLGDAPLGIAGSQSQTTFASPNTYASVRARNLSVDGDRVFFETPDSLVATDTDGSGGCPFIGNAAQSQLRICNDVYMWEAKGSGSCDSDDQNGGCLYLLSSGNDPRPSTFVDASTSGDVAFISTFSALVPKDRDELNDYYAVSVDGGLDAQHRSEPPGCETGSCQGTPAPAAPAPSIGTVGFVGAGNLPPGPAAVAVRVSRLVTVSGHAARLRVRVPAAGRISLSGGLVRGRSKPAPKAGAYTLSAVLNRAARRKLTRRRSLRVGIRVSYRSRDGRSAAKTVQVTFKSRAGERHRRERSRAANRNRGGAK